MRGAFLAFALGVWFLQQQADLPDMRWLWLLPLMSTAWLLPHFSDPWLDRTRRIAVLLVCAAVGFAWAGVRAHVRLAEALPAEWQGVDVNVEGVVSSLPEADARSQRFDFRIDRVLTPRAIVPGHVRLSWMNGDPAQAFQDSTRVHAGERWRLTVHLRMPHGTANPDGFDYEAWLLQHDIRATGHVQNRAGAQRLGMSTNWLDRIQILRERVRDRIRASLSDQSRSGSLTALAIGDQNAVANANWRIYNRTGTSHLLSISGLHITLFASLAGGLVYWLWRRVPVLLLHLPARRAALLAGWLAALAYSTLAGFQIPAQRTLFMLSTLVLGLWLQREPRPFSLLSLALFVVLVIDPWAVLSPGFWLSFGAVSAMMLSVMGVRGHMTKISAWVRAQTAVTVGLAPALLLLFHQVSLVSPLANGIAIPVVGLAVVPLTLAGVIFTPLLHLAAWLMQWVDAYLAWLAAFSWAAWALPAPSAWAVALAMAGTVWLLVPGLPARWLGTFLFLPLLFPHVEKPQPGEFTAEVLDVGQGTSVILRTANHVLLYDTGPAFGDNDAGQQIVLPRLRALGLTRLDGLILTHDDNDHTGGAASVMRDVEIGWLLSSLPAGHALLDRPSIRCERGQLWNWDGVTFEILNPPGYAYHQPGRSDNNKGCVLKVRHGDQSLLLTADAERIGELEMMESEPEKLAATVLMAGHHGSRTSSIPEFVSLVRPQDVIYSCGWRNRYGHPNPEVVARFREMGVKAFRTDGQGWIGLRFSRAGVGIRTWRSAHRRYWQSAL